jgi:hypothetical protein
MTVAGGEKMLGGGKWTVVSQEELMNQARSGELSA